MIDAIKHYEKNVTGTDSFLDFTQLYLATTQTPRDYGNGDTLYYIEVHILTYIGLHPGTTVSDIANHWKRAKSTISEEVSKLERRGYLTKTRDPGNQRICRLELTDKGRELDRCHKEYDVGAIEELLGYLTKRCSLEEIGSFFAVMEVVKDYYRAYLERG